MLLGDAQTQAGFSYGEAYDQPIEAYAPGLTSIATQNAKPGEAWYDSLLRVLPQLALANNQRQLLNLQLERAKAGLPPLDASNYGLGVNVGVSPDLQKTILLGLGALALVLLVARKS